MKNFALDIGNKQVKLISEKGEYTLPSYFVDYEETGEEVDLFSTDKGYDKYEVKFDSDFEYAWGNGINDLDNPKFLDTFTFSDRYSQHFFKLLTSFALGKLAKDFPESKDGVLSVNVVTGVPTNDHNESNVTEIIKHLKGLHEVTINGETYKIDVKDYKILPQPLGTVFSKVIDDSGNIEENGLAQENLTVVDVGGGTVLIDTLKQMNVVNTETIQTDDGVHKLLDRIVIKAQEEGIKGLTKYKLEDILKNKTELGYVYKVNNRGEAFNITKIVEKEVKGYTRKVANTLTSTVKDLTSKDRIIFTGGGSNILDRNQLKENFKYVEFVENPPIANCEGYYKFGLAVFENEGVASE